MAAPKLTDDQRYMLLKWLAADYSNSLIMLWWADRGWPIISRQALAYYRDQCREEIEAIRKERRTSALNSGLALKEERVARLKEHADGLEVIKWMPDDKGKLHNEKAWRATLDDIAKEMGHRRGDDAKTEDDEEKVLIYIPHNDRDDAEDPATGADNDQAPEGVEGDQAPEGAAGAIPQ